MKTLYQLLLDRWNQNCDTVLVTIVEGNGSIPRTTGAYMAADQTGRIYGTIGGGNLEYQAVKKAITLAGKDAHFVEDFDLGTGDSARPVPNGGSHNSETASKLQNPGFYSAHRQPSRAR